MSGVESTATDGGRLAASCPPDAYGGECSASDVNGMQHGRGMPSNGTHDGSQVIEPEVRGIFLNHQSEVGQVACLKRTPNWLLVVGPYKTMLKRQIPKSLEMGKMMRSFIPLPLTSSRIPESMNSDSSVIRATSLLFITLIL
ncbi:unnamed protein product [Gongylonema pulchrum]|uniref:Uncharacterized protein n=1 Tax=Gongylonema pulchrum TaxID=637853 RepID=A0A183EXU7_9BILA|nr:unnamed protein product [Gongylonema pulchrum]